MEDNINTGVNMNAEADVSTEANANTEVKNDIPKKKKRKTGKIIWRILFFLLVLIFLAVLELGKHTIYGWVIAIVIFVLFYWFRSAKLKESGRWIRILTWICLLALCGVILWVSWPPMKRVPAVDVRNPQKTEVIHLEQGDLTGVVTEDGEVEIYAGIPYAKPPVGDLRWTEPQPADGWEGVLEADHFAPMSMQTRNLPLYDSLVEIIGYHDYKISLKDNYRPAVSEDSLYVNVWKPAGTDLKDLPVLVYVHGGTLQTGQPWYEDYSGKGLAKEGVIVVNMGYRLGIFGFFADEQLAAEAPHRTTGNYGLLDQILALQWVQDNIAAFGGDPDNVTLAGESAGSACVSALCTSPLAKGLFRRVLAESSTVTAPEPAHSFRLMDEALEASKDTKKRFHAETPEELRALPAEKIVGELAIHHYMTIDGYSLLESPYESYKKGNHNEEAQLQGYNREEGAPFLFFTRTNMKNYEKKIRESFEDPYADQVLQLFPASTDEEAARNWADIYTAVLFTYGHYCWGRQAAANDIPCYMYYFTKENGRLGSWHSGEEVYLYGNIPPSSKLYTEEDRELSRQFLHYVKNFCETGDPNKESSSGASGNSDGTAASDKVYLPEWQPSTDGTQVLELGNTVGMTEAPYLELYKILDEIQGFEE